MTEAERIPQNRLVAQSIKPNESRTAIQYAENFEDNDSLDTLPLQRTLPSSGEIFGGVPRHTPTQRYYPRTKSYKPA